MKRKESAATPAIRVLLRAISLTRGHLIKCSAAKVTINYRGHELALAHGTSIDLHCLQTDHASTRHETLLYKQNLHSQAESSAMRPETLHPVGVLS